MQVPATSLLADRNHVSRLLPTTATQLLSTPPNNATAEQPAFADFTRAFLVPSPPLSALQHKQQQRQQQQQQQQQQQEATVKMPFEVKPLPYAKNALEPHISQETVETHHEKHHKGYATKLTQLTDGKPEATMSLEDIIRTAAAGPIFNNAAQVWNHTFYFECMMPTSAATMPVPGSALATALDRSFGSVDAFKKAFLDRAAAHFGSGWIWLVQRPADGGLEIWEGHDAATPLRAGLRPLLTVDVWEHAYYIDRRNRRAEYLEHWWPLINWPFVASQLQQH